MTSAAINYKKPILIMGHSVTRHIVECPDRKTLDSLTSQGLWANLSRTQTAQAVSALIASMQKEEALRLLEKGLDLLGSVEQDQT